MPIMSPEYVDSVPELRSATQSARPQSSKSGEASERKYM